MQGRAASGGKGEGSVGGASAIIYTATTIVCLVCKVRRAGHQCVRFDIIT